MPFVGIDKLQRGRRSSRRRSSRAWSALLEALALQRGRRSSRRRSLGLRREVLARLPASTRPPFFTAEVSPPVERNRAKTFASTRPPFFTAEVHGGARRGVSSRTCFNEAAVLHGGGRLAPLGSTPSKTKLQRGRRSSRRRSPNLDQPRPHLLQASTRPPFFTAEVVNALSPDSSTKSMLQRGRRSSRRRSSRVASWPAWTMGASTRPPFFTAEVAVTGREVDRVTGLASTRPPFFTAEVRSVGRHRLGRLGASTRPPFFTAEVHANIVHGRWRLRASTRPPFFTAEVGTVDPERETALRASTRPPFFTAEVRSEAGAFASRNMLQRGRRSSRRRSCRETTRTRGRPGLQRGRRSSRRRSPFTRRERGTFLRASTRPPFFTAEVPYAGCAHVRDAHASTRPPFFTAEVSPRSSPRNTTPWGALCERLSRRGPKTPTRLLQVP